jgi:2-phospho-L-lactate/phosphoenolpyruvate guanylyltransferase
MEQREGLEWAHHAAGESAAAGPGAAAQREHLVLLVPQKRLDRAKTRLAGVLSEEDRQSLALELLRRTLTVCAQLPGVSRLLLSCQDELRALAAEFGAEVVRGGFEGMRRDITACSGESCVVGQAALLIVSADLPLLRVADLEEVVGAWREGAGVVLAPDRRRRGTNVMLVNDPEHFEYAFGQVVGPGSFPTHQSLAEGLGLRVAVVENPRLALDLDLPVDLIAFITEAGDDPLAQRLKARARELPYFE